MASSDPPSPFSAVAGGVRLAVRVTPRAARERIEGTALEADGTAVLRLAVTAPAEDGKANAALVRLLAKRWKLPRSAIAVLRGKHARRKLLHLTGEPRPLLALLESWLRENHG